MPKAHSTFRFSRSRLTRERSSALSKAVFFATVIVFFATFFSPLLHDLFYEWSKDEYSHGYFLPFIALLMGMHILAKAPPSPQPSWIGIPLLIFNLAVIALGTHAAARHFVLLSIWASLIALSLVYIGTRATKRLMPAFIFLLFSFPAPTEMYSNVSLALQLLSSQLGALLLDILGISVFQDGNIIDLGSYKLQVAEACSGLRYMFPLMSFGYLAAFMLKDRWWKRITLFLSTILIAIVTNIFRIATVGIGVNIWGTSFAEGFIHEFHGFVIFALCIVLLLGEIKILLAFGKGGTFDMTLFSLPKAPFFNGVVPCWPKGIVFLAVLLLVSPYALYGGFGDKEPMIPNHGSLSAIPLNLDTWHGTSEAINPEALNILKLTDYTQINYVDPSMPSAVNLYVALLAKQTMGIIIHPPTNCLPGGGWHIEDEKELSLTTVDTGKEPLNLVRLLIKSGENKMIVYFWYEQQGQKVTGQLQGRFRLMVNSLLYNRTDGALIRLMTPLAPHEAEETADARLLSILKMTIPYVDEVLPKEEGKI